MVEVPIYTDTDNPEICDNCRNRNDHGTLSPCLNTSTNCTMMVCKKCLDENDNLIPVEECFPSNDVVM